MASLLYFCHPDFLLFRGSLSYKPCTDNYEHNKKRISQISQVISKFIPSRKKRLHFIIYIDDDDVDI